MCVRERERERERPLRIMRTIERVVVQVLLRVVPNCSKAAFLHVAIGISLFFGWCFTVLGGMDDVVEPWALADMYQLERLLKYFYMGALERGLCVKGIYLRYYMSQLIPLCLNITEKDEFTVPSLKYFLLFIRAL